MKIRSGNNAGEVTLDAVFDFGGEKGHKGESLREVIDNDIGYVQWCLEKKIFKMDMAAKKYYTFKAIEPLEKKKNWRF